MTDVITCPRRLHEPGPWDHERFLDHWGADGTCSFCGSVRPEEFFRRAVAGEQITPTDKSYKVYLEGHRKFYLQHLSDDQQARFIALHNAGQLRLDYPGYFYVQPYFCAPRRINGHAG